MNNTINLANENAVNMAQDLESWGKIVTVDDANEIMQSGNEIVKEAFLNMLFAWQRFNQRR